jgi:hypothetical protein
MARSLKTACAVLALATAGACASLGDELEGVSATEQASSPAWTWGFAWIDPGFPISPAYSFNSSGGTNSYSGSLGLYSVFMPGLDQAGGNVQVTAYGTTSVRCKVGSWTTSSLGTSINVRCHNPAGVLTASPFVVSFDNGGPGVGSWYLWYDGVNAPGSYSYNAAGSTNSVTRLGLGSYRANLGGLTSSNLSVHVTAYGNGPEHCSIASYGTGYVNVRCFNTSGGDADSMFTLHVTGSAPRAGMIGGHAYINGTTSAPLPYQRNQHWVSCFSTPPITVTAFRSVYYPDTGLVPAAPTTALTTAYGSNGNYCKLTSWTSQATGYVVHSQCYTPAGVPVNNPFVSGFMMASWPAPC